MRLITYENIYSLLSYVREKETLLREVDSVDLPGGRVNSFLGFLSPLERCPTVHPHADVSACFLKGPGARAPEEGRSDLEEWAREGGKSEKTSVSSGDPSEVVRNFSPGGMVQAATSSSGVFHSPHSDQQTSTLFLFCCSCMRL